MKTTNAKGIASPYADDTNRYLWDFEQDVLRTTDLCEVFNKQITKKEAGLLVVAGTVAADDPEYSEPPLTSIKHATEITAFYVDKDVLMLVLETENGTVFLSHPKWVGVEWDSDAAAYVPK